MKNASAPRGHLVLQSSLRSEEVTLLNELTSQVQGLRLPGRKVLRSAVIRASIRYALENEGQFLAWMAGDEDAV